MQSHDTKRCSTCHDVFPNTPEYFHKNTKRKDGLNNACKECAKATARKHSANAEAKRQEKLKTDPEYREHRNATARERRKDPVRGEKIRANARKSSAKRDPEKKKAYLREYYAENKERVLAQQRAKNGENRQIARNRVAQWAKDNPEKHKANMKKQKAKKRAIIKQAEGHHTAKDILAIYEEQDGLCAYCGIRLFDEYEVDHYQPLAKGGANSVDNLFCVCLECNSSKRDKLPEEWIAWRNSHVI